MKTLAIFITLSLLLTVVTSQCYFDDFAKGATECEFYINRNSPHIPIKRGEKKKIENYCCDCKIEPDDTLSMSCCSPGGE
ncbi:hypothetical protein SNE40_022226 [Patella caerulea]